MQKAIRLSTSKYHIRYTEEFKRQIRDEYLSGQKSKSELARNHGIGGGAYRITLWLRSMNAENRSTFLNPLDQEAEMKEESE
ncbi:MAG: transposase [SAR324 cluster bacterium]|nr:transposase [SAR324 cluster bacterium]